MNKPRLIAGAIVVAAILIAAVGTWLALYVFTPGRAPHEEFLPRDNAIRIVLQPYRVQREVSGLVPDATRFIKAIPKVMSTQGRPFRIDWIHNLPYEFSFLIQQNDLDHLGVRLYVNEKPDMNSFVGEVNNSGFFNAVRGVVWNPPRLRGETQTAYIADGRAAIPTGTQQIVQTLFGGTRIPDPVDYTGNHFFEMTGSNNAGAFGEFQGVVIRNWGSLGGDDLHTFLRETWHDVLRVRITGDWTGPDRMDFDLSLVVTPNGDPGRVEEAHDFMLDRLVSGLQSWQGLNFSGSAEWQNSRTLVGRYTLTNFEPALQRALRIR